MGGFKLKYKKSLILLLTILFLASGCAVGSSASNTLASHDTELPNDIASEIPFPKEGTIQFGVDRDDGISFMFSPGITYPEFIDFYSKELSANGWTKTNESIPDREEGERYVEWNAEKDGLKVYVNLTAFGEIDGFNMSGFITVEGYD